MELPKEIIRLCADLGFAASRFPSMGVECVQIFEGIRVVSPDSPVWAVGHGMVYANAGRDPGRACAFLNEQGITEDSGDMAGRAFLGMFLALAKRSAQSEKVLNKVIDDGSDEQAVELAQTMLDNMKLVS
ncbi:MAG: hypothetical protein ACR2P9_00375 [Gammaproteobacteria bacterium]